MSVDFLRNIAFDGELQSFFLDDPLRFAERSTGMHLRFNEWFLQLIAEAVRRYAYRESVPLLRPSRLENWYDRLDFASALNASLDYLWKDHTGDDYRFPRLRNYIPEDLDRRKTLSIVVDLSEKSNELFGKGRREYEGFPIVYRLSGPIQAHYAIGSALSCTQAGTTGTLCSFLEDQESEKIFALTCGHFARSLGHSIEDGAGKYAKLGNVVNMVIPAGIGPCNNRHGAPSSVDAALIEVEPNAPITQGKRKIVQPIASITPGDLVEFIGRGTGKVQQAKVMSATIWKLIDLLGNGQLVCCGDIFEISHQATMYVQSSLSRPGDSGAAVRRLGQRGSLDQWFGMLIGGERSSSYICYAETVMDWARRHYPNISLLP